jgi:inhibitor of KinA sporulation pathway (predicted exonuclease)
MQSNSFSIRPQPFDYYLICDGFLTNPVEGTCLEDSGFDYASEIIEFPVILIRSNPYEVIDVFHTYIRPTINPILSDFCTKLTGITQEMVATAPLFKDVFDSFHDWLQSHVPESFDECIFVTDGPWDLRDFVLKECVYIDRERPEFMNQIVDIRKEFELFYKQPKTNLDGMLRYLQMEFEGREHSGIDDSKNIERIFRKMIQDGCRMDVNTDLTKKKPSGKWKHIRK